jgi:hypothetical protein
MIIIIYRETVLEKRSVDCVYKATLLGTSHVVRKCCSLKLEALAVGLR